MTATLGSVCYFLNGGTPNRMVARFYAGNTPWITGADIGGPVVNEARRFITDEAINASATNLVPAGTVLLVTRTSVGKVAIAGTPLCFSQDITAITPDPSKLDTRYLVRFLRTKQPYFERVARGATIKGVTRETVKNIRVPLPPLSEQQRISEILDKADALRDKRRAALAQLDALSQSIFLDMFGDPATNPKRWPLRRIRDVARVITGNTPPRAVHQYYGNAIEWIKSDNINTPDYYLTRAEEGLSELGRQAARVVPAESILVTCIAGSPDSIGNSAMTDREVAFNQQINAIVPIEGNPHFVYGQLRVGKRLVQQASTASMKGMVNKSRFENIALAWPPISLQQEFEGRVLAVEAATRAQTRSLETMNRLFGSLQQRAFRGAI